MTPTVVVDELALAEFRDGPFSAGTLRPSSKPGTITLINVPIGTGKSHLLDDLLDQFLASAAFDLVVVLAALTANLLERRLIRRPTPGVRRLRPRPRADCGPLDLAWRPTSGTGLPPTPGSTSAARAPTSATVSGRVSMAVT